MLLDWDGCDFARMSLTHIRTNQISNKATKLQLLTGSRIFLRDKQAMC